jgi:hypothetical protein
MQHETLETVAQTASKVTYLSSGGAVFFGLTANEFAAIGGLAIAAIGLLVNIYYKRRAFHLMQKKYEADGVID